MSCCPSLSSSVSCGLFYCFLIIRNVLLSLSRWARLILTYSLCLPLTAIPCFSLKHKAALSVSHSLPFLLTAEHFSVQNILKAISRRGCMRWRTCWPRVKPRLWTNLLLKTHNKSLIKGPLFCPELDRPQSLDTLVLQNATLQNVLRPSWCQLSW